MFLVVMPLRWSVDEILLHFLSYVVHRLVPCDSMNYLKLI